VGDVVLQLNDPAAGGDRHRLRGIGDSEFYD
jgi:hypothetical protein